MIGMGVCVAAYMTKSALKFLEKNVATKVSNYKTSLWRVFSLCASSNYIEIKCCFYDFYICCLFLRFDSYFAKYLTTAVATAEEDVVLVALPLTHLSNEIFKTFEIFKLFTLPNCPMEYSEYSKYWKCEKNILENNIVSPVCGRCTGSCWRTVCAVPIRWSGRWYLWIS